MKLEELARQSSVAARSSVAHLDLPPIGQESPARSWMPVLAGAGVAAALVAGLAFVISNRSADVSDPADHIPAVVEVPHLALPPDSGWTATLATDGAEFANLRGDEVPTFAYYGASESDEPYADGDLLIAWYWAPEGAVSEPSPDSEPVAVRGVTGQLSKGSGGGAPADSLTLSWMESGADGSRVQILLVSQRFDRERLVSIAESLSVDAAALTVTPDIDLGLDLHGTADGTPFDAFRTSTDGSLVGYERTGGDRSESVVLSTARGDIDQETLILRWWFPDLEPVTVNGRPGYISQADDREPGFGRTTIWAPREGVLANLTYFGADESFDPIALAESAIELDDAAWATLVGDLGPDVARDMTGDFDEVFAVNSGSAAGVDYSWVLGLKGDDLCFDFETNGGFGTCQPRAEISPPAGSAITIDNSFGDQIGDVVIAADPSIDDIVEVEGRYEVYRVDADGLSWFVAIGDASVQPMFDVIVDGEVVDTLEAGVEERAVEDDGILDVPAAVEMGIETMEVVFSDQTDSGFPRWIGRMGDDLCLVSGGAESTATCVAQADITVFDPIAGTEGPLTYVVALDPPDCVVDLEVPGESYLSTNAGNADHDYLIVALPSPSDEWQLRLMLDSSVEPVRLPATEGSADYPADLCASD
ncbi:MAG: hypothetical protein HKN41_05695 [Ilumatobacter sp.]|nr:hypothetical protein [Ilumatobacter sp.]